MHDSPELAGLPAEIGQLTSLQGLDLAFAPLTELPAEFLQLTSLQQPADLADGARPATGHA